MSPKITDNQLLAYAAGELDDAEAGRIEAHLANDATARTLVERYQTARQTVLNDDTVAAPAEAVARARSIFRRPRTTSLSQWLDRLETTVANLLFDSRVQPALAGFRGGSEQFQAAWENETAEVEIEGSLVDIGTRPGGRRWQITGQITTPDASRATTVAVARTGTLEAIVTTTVDETGMFSFEAPADRYDLLIEVNDQAIVVTDVELA